MEVTGAITSSRLVATDAGEAASTLSLSPEDVFSASDAQLVVWAAKLNRQAILELQSWRPPPPASAAKVVSEAGQKTVGKIVDTFA